VVFGVEFWGFNQGEKAGAARHTCGPALPLPDVMALPSEVLVSACTESGRLPRPFGTRGFYRKMGGLGIKRLMFKRHYEVFVKSPRYQRDMFSLSWLGQACS